MGYELRPEQGEVLQKANESARRGHRSILVQAPCGFGKTVVAGAMAKQVTDCGQRVLFLVHRRELLKQTEQTFGGFGLDPGLTDICMAQTYSRHLSDYREPHLMITDECHMAAAVTWRRIYDHWPGSLHVGFSATPCRLDGKALGDIFTDMVLAPQTDWLIKNQRLSPYRYYSVDVADLSKLRRKGADYDMESAQELLDRPAIYSDVIREFQKHAADKRTVVYCSTVRHSQTTTQAFCEAGYKAEHIDGSTPQKARDEIVERFRTGQTQVLCNVDIVSVGFDLPAIECCIMLRPTQSTALYIQQAGRALRYVPDKTALILDCVANHTRHGLPDDDREWSLTAPIRNKNRFTETGQLAIRTCYWCYAVYPASKSACPVCGEVYVTTPEELRQIRTVELKEIERRQERKKQAYNETRSAKLHVEADCKSYNDLLLLAKKVGMPDPKRWAISRAYAKGFTLPWTRNRR